MRLILMLVLLVAGVASAQVTGQCGPGKRCNVRQLNIQSGGIGNTSFTMPNLDTMNVGACAFQANGASVSIGQSTACNATFTGGTTIGNSGISLATVTLTTSLATPSAIRGFAADTTTNRVWRSDVSTWNDVGTGVHPVTDAQLYWYAADLGTSGAPAWKVTPRYNAADVAFTVVSGTAATTTGGQYTIGTTAAAGNQAHHSTGVFFTRNGVSGGAGNPGFRWAARVAFSTGVGDQRTFVGASSALPLTAGSDTPTATAAVFRYSPAGAGGNLFACLGQATALQCTDTGVAASSSLTRLEIDCRDATPACTFWVNGIARTRLTANIPVGNVYMGSTISVEAKTANARLVTMSQVSIEQ